MDFLRLLHIASVGFFSGSLFSMLMVQSLLQRAVEAPERLILARTSSTLARVVVNPLAYLGFFSGLAFWYARYSQFGASRLFRCAPVYVHIMLTCGFLALGFTQMWKARARKLAQGVERNAPLDELRPHVARGWMYGLLALLCISTAYSVAVLKIPSHISPACFADAFPH